MSQTHHEENSLVQFEPADSNQETIKASSFLWDQILYLIDSILGKYSIETYLEVMNDFIDSEIRESQKQGMTYTGGQVAFSTTKESDKYVVEVQLYFTEPGTQQYSVKRAERQLAKKKFIRRDIERLEACQKLEFNVEKPED